MILKFVKSNHSGRKINLPFVGKKEISAENSFEVEDEVGEKLLNGLKNTGSEVEIVGEVEESVVEKINKMSKKELQEYVEEAGLELPDNIKKVADIREHIISLIS